MLITIRINGTDTNPWHRFGLTRNPFPQVGLREWDSFDRFLAELGAKPMPTTEALNKFLAEARELAIPHRRDDFDRFCEVVRMHYVPGDIASFMFRIDV